MKKERRKKSGGMGSLYKRISLPTLSTKIRNQGYHNTGYVSFFADHPPYTPKFKPYLAAFFLNRHERVGERFSRLHTIIIILLSSMPPPPLSVTRPAIILLFSNQSISHSRNHQILIQNSRNAARNVQTRLHHGP